MKTLTTNETQQVNGAVIGQMLVFSAVVLALAYYN